MSAWEKAKPCQSGWFGDNLTYTLRSTCLSVQLGHFISGCSLTCCSSRDFLPICYWGNTLSSVSQLDDAASHAPGPKPELYFACEQADILTGPVRISRSRWTLGANNQGEIQGDLASCCSATTGKKRPSSCTFHVYLKLFSFH